MSPNSAGNIPKWFPCSKLLDLEVIGSDSTSPSYDLLRKLHRL